MKLSTATLKARAQVVPWLAATGPLAYSPASPPERDYFFQYSWIIPGILRPDTNKRRHLWFGGFTKDCPDVIRLFRFWNQARVGQYDALYLSNGNVEEAVDVTAPIAAYRHVDVHPSGFREELLVLMQHGSYHVGDIHSQPLADRGEALLYRGVQLAETYLLHRVTAAVGTRLTRVHARTLTDSVVSFNAVHCNLVRSETVHLNDRSFVFDGHCRDAGLEPDDPTVRSVLYSGYALEDWCASRKFGPNYVKFRTPLTNIRITTFVCGESE